MSDDKALEAARRIVALADRFAKCRAEFPIEKDWDFDACSEHEEPFVSACIEHGECIARALLSASPEKGEREKALEKALEDIIRLPPMPFPDPGAHSWQAFGQAVHRAWREIQSVAARALAAPGEG